MLAVTSENLEELVTKALERMAFVFSEPVPVNVDEVLAHAVAHASIELRGRRIYTITVSATDGFVRDVASGMIGCDAEEVDVDEHAQAAVSELANVFGGELVMQMTEESEDMLIGLPQELEAESVGRLSERAADVGHVCVVGSDGGELVVTVASDGSGGGDCPVARPA